MSVSSTLKKNLYLDTSLPFAERAKDLVGRLTLEEKISLMNHPAQGVPRLNIPAYNYWSEALHGVARNGRATVFPQAMLVDYVRVYQRRDLLGSRAAIPLLARPLPEPLQ